MNFLKQSSQERRELILNGNILQTLLLLSTPTLLVGLIQALIPLSDGLFLNNFGGTVVASSVSFSQPVLNTMISLSQGLSAAAMAIIGQLYGRGNMKSVKETALQIFIFSFFIGMLLIPICIISAFFIGKMVNSEFQYYVFTYIALYSISLPLVFLASIFNAIKNSTGQPEMTLIRISILLVLKIVFNTLFLYIFKLGIIGASLSTLFSYIIISIWMYYDLFLKKSDMQLNLKEYHVNTSIIKNLLIIAIPSMLGYVLINLAFFLINLEVEKYGINALNAQGIAANINSICFILPSAIGTTVTTMISMNIGVGKIDKAKKIFRYGYLTSIVISLLILIIVIPLKENLTILFTRKKDILLITNHALSIYTYSIIPFGIFMVCQSVFISLGRTKIPLFMGVLRIWFFRYLFIIFSQKLLGVYSVFWGNLFSNTVAAILFFILTKNINWENNNIKHT